MTSGARSFDDLQVGDRFETAARTITEADVVGFAQLSGDWNPIHTDVEFARASGYGQRVVHGMLGLCVAIGLLDRLGTFSGTAVANIGISDWRFEKPLFIGDTIRAQVEITELRATSDGKRGIVGRAFTVLNQQDEVVQRGSIGIMLRRREDPA